MTVISDEELMAYADGELDDKAADRVRAALAHDPQLRAGLSRHYALKSEIEGAFAEIDAAPLPESVRALIADAEPGESTVVPLWRRRTSAIIPRALAASFAGALIVVGVLMTGPQDPVGMSAALVQALDHEPDGTAIGPLHVGDSYLAEDGSFCRSFTMTLDNPGRGLACRARGNWSLVARVPLIPEGAFLPAGEQAADPLEAYLAPLRPLGLDEEKQYLRD